MCQWHIDLFGGAPQSSAPFDRYLFQVTAVGDGYGGLEHRTSTSLLCRRDELPVRGRAEINDRYLHLLGLASEMEAERDHILGAPKDPDGLDDDLLERAQRTEDAEGELDKRFEALSAARRSAREPARARPRRRNTWAFRAS